MWAFRNSSCFVLVILIPNWKSYLSETYVNHGDVMVAFVSHVHSRPERHYEVSQRQQAHQVQKNVQKVSLAPVSSPADRNKGETNSWHSAQHAAIPPQI